MATVTQVVHEVAAGVPSLKLYALQILQVAIGFTTYVESRSTRPGYVENSGKSAKSV